MPRTTDGAPQALKPSSVPYLEGGSYQLRAETEQAGTAELLIYGPVGSWDVDAADVARQLQDTEAETIRVRINSPGGSAFDGVAIMNALTGHTARVVVEVDGLAASAASIIAMAGDEVVMRPGSEMMIHEAHVLAAGEAKDMRQVADMLDKTNDSMAQVYADRAGGDTETWREAMAAETWFTADEAVEAGLADRVDRRARPVADAAESFALVQVFAYTGRDSAPAPDTAALRGTDNEEFDVDFIKAVAQELGADTDDADTVLAALKEALAEQAKAPAEVEAAAEELPDDDETAKAAAAAGTGVEAEADTVTLDEARAWRAAYLPETVADDADTVTLDEATYRDLLDRAAAGDDAQASLREAEAAAAVDAAVDDGRILAVRRGDWIANYVADPADTEARLANLAPGRINREEQGHARSDGTKSDNLTARAKATGLAAAPKL